MIERVGQAGALDLEACEFYIRTAMLTAGTRVLEQLLHDIGTGRRAEALLCDGGHTHLPARMESLGVREKTLTTILGPLRWRRSAYRCPACGAVEYPGDALLGVVGTGFSPGARRMMARAGAGESFARAAGDLDLYAGLKIDAKDVERTAEATGAVVEHWLQVQSSQARLQEPAEAPNTLYISFDGTGVPMRRAELAGRRGKGEGGAARTREVKLGCVFTQTGRDESGRPVREEHSTSYVGAIENSTEFGHRIHGEALRRGLARAGRVVVLTDGAAYNKSIRAEHFPGALHILDLYHAREHLAEFVRESVRAPVGAALHEALRELLDSGRIEQLTERMRGLLPRSGPRRKSGLLQIDYFTANAQAMRYDRFREQGLFIGSGVIEAGCRTIVAQRLKRSGMFWSLRGANAILALRCCFASGRFEQFWEDSA